MNATEQDVNAAIDRLAARALAIRERWEANEARKAFVVALAAWLILTALVVVEAWGMVHLIRFLAGWFR